MKTACKQERKTAGKRLRRIRNSKTDCKEGGTRRQIARKQKNENVRKIKRVAVKHEDEEKRRDPETVTRITNTDPQGGNSKKTNEKNLTGPKKFSLYQKKIVIQHM